MTQEQAMEILKMGGNVFLTGEPGSGKTYTVNKYIEYLRGQGITPAITASTGIAATHINGLTIHSWSGIGIKEFLTANELQAIAEKPYIAKRVLKAKILIIDEISMLEAKTFALVDLVCRKIRASEKPFGGLQIAAVGDFFQLPPISKGANIAQFAFKSDVWDKANFAVCYLTEQFRQDDDNFLEILSSIRANNFSDIHLQDIQTRVVEFASSPQNITRLFSHNVDVDAINSQELAKLPGKAKTFQMFSRGRKNLVDNLKKGCLAPEILELKPGACVMCVKNNLKAGFVNGTLGKIIGFNQETRYPIIRTTDNQEIEISPMEWTLQEGDKIMATISQVPLRLAWAITIHKSQGMSMDAAVMDLQKTFEFGQGYVALSRVRRLSGLYLLGYNQKAFLTHPEMQIQDKFFRAKSEQVQEKLVSTPKDEILQKQNNFLLSCGGSLGKKSVKDKARSAKKEKQSTYDITLLLIQQDKTIKEIAQTRCLAFGTIIGHIENLVLKNKVNQQELERLIGDNLLAKIPEIASVFRDMDTDNLLPIFNYFQGEYSYDELRLARLMLMFDAVYPQP